MLAILSVTYILQLLKQPSTYKGLVLILGAVGLVISPEQAQSIVAAAIAILGVWEAFRNEKKPADTTPLFKR
jgi:uncharacterized membrane protein